MAFTTACGVRGCSAASSAIGPALIAVDDGRRQQHDAASDTGEAGRLEQVQRPLDVADDARRRHLRSRPRLQQAAGVDHAVDAALADELQQPRQVEQLAQRGPELLVGAGLRRGRR